MIEQLRDSGAPEHVIKQAVTQRLDDRNDLEVFEDTVESIKRFYECSTQWNVISGLSGGGLFGMRYEGIKAYFEMAGIPEKRQSELLADFQVMEQAALEAQREN